MPNYTPNYNLKKPLSNENYNVEDQNNNMDIIDEKLKEIEDGIENIEVPVTSVNEKTGDVVLTAEDVGAETPTGAQAKADAAEAAAKAYADQEVADLAGEGRTTETVKGNADALDAHLAEYAQLFPDNAGAHNGIYRGKHLGNSVTSAQYANIANGSFKDMYIGDYWTIGGVNYRIAAFNYYYNVGDTALTQNHITLVPDTCLYTHVMNETNITEGGYTGSLMYEEGLDEAKSIIHAAFPGHVVTHRKYLCNAVADGQASAGAWVDSEVDLMNEVMVHGSVVNGRATYGAYNIGTEKSQLPLFRFRHDLIGIRASWWLRDVSSASSFANVYASGFADHHYASGDSGVRPAFSIS